MRARWVASGILGSLLSSGAVRAQSEPVANDVFVELVGSAPVASVNYERLLASHLGLRVGFGYLRATSFLGNDLDRVQIPVVLSVTVGGGASRLEIGAGAVPGVLTPSGSAHRVETPATAEFRYRDCPPEGGC